MEKITKEEFLRRCANADASTNVNALIIISRMENLAALLRLTAKI